MDQTGKAMSGIRLRGEEIGKIVKTIDEIAFQTNLLALNAAVEAVRAGEAGSGFAVVAGEVRNLATRSSDAAENIQQLIEKTIEEIKTGSSLLDRTTHVFTETAEQNAATGILIDKIARASEEQVQGIDEIRKTMSEIDEIVQQNKVNAEIFSSVFVKLNGQAERMSYFIRKLKGLIEKREQIRVKISLKGEFLASGTGRTYPFVTNDISAGGVSIFTSQALEMDTEGEIAIKSRHIQFPWLRGKVVRLPEKPEDGKFLTGIRFIDVSPSIEDVILDILSTDIEEEGEEQEKKEEQEEELPDWN
jgi:hypothetical protein